MIAMPVVLESAVALLLVVTLGYCVVLERRIRGFRHDQQALRELIAELDGATARAERAVAGLSQTTREVRAELDSRISDARSLTRSIAMIARTTSRHAATPGRRGRNGPAAEAAG
jgi:hypothetical protein